MISQLFILSPRGDVIINKQFRLDVPVKITTEVFFRTVKFWKDGDKAPAVFNEDGVNYVHVKVAGLFVAATTRKNVSPSLVLELLHRVAKVIKDYCGVLSEDALRKNSILAYELIDEMLDHGYAQTTDTETLKQRVFNEPIHATDGDVGKSSVGGGVTPKKYGFFSASVGQFGSGGAPTSAKRSAVNRSVIATPQGPDESAGGRNEIFVDVVEKLNVTFASDGSQVSSEIDGSIQVRNFLHDRPTIKLALNEELAIGGRDLGAFGGPGRYQGYSAGGGMAVLLDDCNFHESADLSQFDVDRTISMTPPAGEFALMNYRAAGEFDPPFRLQTVIDDGTPYRLQVTLMLKAEFPARNTCTGLQVKFPVPRNCVNAHPTLEQGSAGSGQQHAAYTQADRAVVWQFKKVKGQGEHVLTINVSFPDEASARASKKECGPATLSFTIPTYNASRLQVRYLQIGGGPTGGAPDGIAPGGGGKDGKGAHRWVRYVTKSSSYVCRV